MRTVFQKIYLPLCLIVACLGLWAIWQRGNESTSNMGEMPMTYLPPLGGDYDIEYLWPSRFEHIAFIRFEIEWEGEFPEGEVLKVELLDEESGAIVWEVAESLGDFNQASKFCQWQVDLDVIQGHEYRWRLSMPDTEAGKGIRVSVSWSYGAYPGMLWKGGKQSNRHHLVFHALSELPELNYVLFGACIVLVFTGLFFVQGWPYWLGSFLVAAIALIDMSLYAWGVRCYVHVAEYWPDGYPMMSEIIYYVIDGRLSFSKEFSGLVNFTHGQSWFVPLLMALLKHAGVSTEWAYRAINIVAYLGAVGYMSYYLRRVWKFTWLQLAVSGMILLLNVYAIRAAATMTTDAAALGMGSIFLVSYLFYIECDRVLPRMGWGALVVIALFFGCTTRIALFPGLVVPIAVGVWAIIFEKKHSLREGLILMIPGMLASTLVAVFYFSTGFTSAFTKAFEFSRIFVSNFSYPAFVVFLLLSLQCAWLSCRWWVPAIFHNRRIATLFGYFCGMVLLLLLGELSPWVRYWTVPSFVALCMGLIGMKMGRWSDVKWKLVGTLFVGVHLILFLMKPGMN